jgi:flagellar hook-length control protein FliK
MSQGATANGIDSGNSTNTAGQSASNLVETLKGMMTQSSSGGQTGNQGNGSQSGATFGAALSGAASGQSGIGNSGLGGFASNLGIDGIAMGGQANSLQVQHAAQVANIPTPNQAATNMQTPTVQIGFHIAKAVDQGINRMSIRLDPAELGRVQIQLEVGGDGRVQAMIMADKQDTLDLLQKDAKMLEKVMKDAGLETSSEDLSFSLHQGSQNSWASNKSSNFGNPDQETDASDELTIASQDQELPEIVSNRALDVRV